MRKVKPKAMRGQLVSGPQLVDLAESYTEAINKGGVPVIESAWQYMQSGQLDAAFHEALKQHKTRLDDEVGN